MALIREDYSIHSLTYNSYRINERTALALNSRESKLAGPTLPIAVSLALEIASLKMDSIPCQRSFALAKSRALVSLSTHFARNAEYKSLCILIPQQICHRLLRVFLTACSQIWHTWDSFVVCVGNSNK